MSGIIGADLNNTIIVALIFHFVLTIMVLNYSLNHYMQTRVKSYKTYMILGMRHTDIKKILFIEYCCGGIFAMITGFGAGLLVTLAIGGKVQKYYTLTGLGYSWVNYQVTAIVLCLVIVVTLLFCNYKMCCQGQIIVNKKIKKKIYRLRRTSKRLLFFVLSILCILSGLILQGTILKKTLYLIKEVPLLYSTGVVLYSIGVAVFFYVGLEYILLRMREKNTYHPKLIYITNFLKQVQNSQKILCAVFLVHYVLFTLLLIRLNYSVPVSEKIYESAYPYDLVWVNENTDKKLISEIQGDIEYSKKIPYVLVTATYMKYQPHFIGISEETYNELSGQNIKLEKSEVYSISGGSSSLSGRSEVALAAVSRANWSRRYVGEEFLLRGVEKRNLLGDGMDSVIVFSNERFQSYERLTKTMVVQNIKPSEQKSVVLRLLKESRSMDFMGSNSGVGIKSVEAQGQLMIKTVTFIIMMVFVLSFIFYSLYFTGMRVWNQVPEWAEQNLGLQNLGMRKQMREKMISKEMKILFFMPAISAFLCSVPYVLFYIILEGKQWADYNQAIAPWLVVYAFIAVCFVLYCLYYLYLKRLVFKQIARYDM